MSGTYKSKQRISQHQLKMYTELRRDQRGHTWQHSAAGHNSIDVFAWNSGQHCNGPVCVTCGYGEC